MWNDDDASYPIGFARPPRETQFRKGRSGNPNGRPRKIVALAEDSLAETKLEAALKRLFKQPLTVKDGAGVRSMTVYEALAHRLLQDALKGKQLAARTMIQAADEIEQRERARAQAQAEQERRMFNWVVGWKAQRERDWEKAEREDREPDEVWPHPDDILIDQTNQSYRIRGPLDESMVPFFEYAVAMRDMCACEQSLALRQRGKLYYYIAALYEVTMFRYEAMLPLRWQHGSSLPRINFSLDMMGTRELRKLAASIEADALHWHKIAYPNGQKIKLGPKQRKLCKPFLPLLKVGSVQQLESKWEQESGNPPGTRSFAEGEPS